MIPLPFTCQHEHYATGAQDDHGNAAPDWAEPVPVDCFWWSGSSSEPFAAPTGSDQVSVDVTLVVDSAVAVDQRDRFTVNGRAFEVVGLPKEWDHGPFDFTPDRQVIELKRTG